MDFKKAYKEALERAKAGMPLDEVFPELKESEDERIREEIIEFLTYGIWSETTIDKVKQSQRYAKWIYYLEKQKEQQSADVSEKIKELCSKYPLNKNVASKQELSAYHQGLAFGATKIAEYLGAHQPAEWSEEDKEYLAACIDVIDNFYTLSGELKSLTKINVLRKEYAEKLKSWLKSLRPQPHWKPSKEQLNALHAFVGMIHPDARYDAVLSLLNDLQKLL